MFTPLTFKLIPRAVKRERQLTLPSFYSLDWFAYAKHCEGFDSKENLSFQKMMKDVKKASGTWRGLIKSLIGSADTLELLKNRVDCLNIDTIFKTKIRSVLMWVPSGAGIKKENLSDLVELLSPILTDWLVVPICSDVTSNEEAEKYILNDRIPEALRQGKRGVWILSSGMGARSFSVPHIDLVILAYDKGSEGATVQRMFRALTSEQGKSHAHILSLSIDGNRDEKFSGMILETAVKMQLRNQNSLEQNLREVLRTLCLFDVVKDGKLVQITEDEYAQRYLEASSISRLCYNEGFDFFGDPEVVQLISSITSSTSKKPKLDLAFDLGQSYESKDSVKSLTPKQKKEAVQDFREKLRSIALNIHVLALAAATSDLNEAIEIFKSDSQMNQELEEIFGLDIYGIESLLIKGVFNRQILETSMIVSFNKNNNLIK